MSTLSVDDLILEPTTYSTVRDARRSEAIEIRRARRVRIGELVVIEFESAATLRYQAQEMLYVERVTDPIAAAAEIAGYERLLPTTRSIAATMLLEIEDQAQVRSELARLDGIHDRVRLEIGSISAPARDIPPPDEGPTQHTVSVHFLGFDLSASAITALSQAADVQLVIDHPAYQARTTLTPELVALIAADVSAAATA